MVSHTMIEIGRPVLTDSIADGSFGIMILDWSVGVDIVAWIG